MGFDKSITLPPPWTRGLTLVAALKLLNRELAKKYPKRPKLPVIIERSPWD